MFLIFSMKFGKNISKKVTKPDFSKKIPFLEKRAKRGQKWGFSRFFKVFSELDHGTFLIFGMKLGKNICKNRVKTDFSKKISNLEKWAKKGQKITKKWNLFHFFENKTLQIYLYETRSFEDTCEDNFEEKKCRKIFGPKKVSRRQKYGFLNFPELPKVTPAGPGKTAQTIFLILCMKLEDHKG